MMEVSSLQSFFAGLAYPLNSVGVLPTAFINATEASVSEGLLQNALEIYEQYSYKAFMKRQNSLFFKNYKPLDTADSRVYIERADGA